MKRMAKRMVVLGFALLAACGGGGSGDDEGVVSATDTGQHLGCDVTIEPAEDREIFVADSGTCVFEGYVITIYRFSTNKSRDQWINVASEFGVGRYVVFDRGVVTSDDQDAADAVKAKIGGAIRT